MNRSATGNGPVPSGRTVKTGTSPSATGTRSARSTIRPGAGGGRRRPSRTLRGRGERLLLGVPAERERRDQPEDERRDDGEEAVDEHRGDDARVRAAEADKRAGEAELVDPDAARSQRDRRDHPHERPGGERLDERDLRRPHPARAQPDEQEEEHEEAP